MVKYLKSMIAVLVASALPGATAIYCGSPPDGKSDSADGQNDQVPCLEDTTPQTSLVQSEEEEAPPALDQASADELILELLQEDDMTLDLIKQIRELLEEKAAQDISITDLQRQQIQDKLEHQEGKIEALLDEAEQEGQKELLEAIKAAQTALEGVPDADLDDYLLHGGADFADDGDQTD